METWHAKCNFHHTESDTIHDNTLEERVALLEVQVADLEENMADVDQSVNFLFYGQVIQNLRMHTLGQDNNIITEELEGEFYMIKITIF